MQNVKSPGVFARIKKKLKIRKIRKTILRLCSILVLTVALGAAALPVAADDLPNQWTNMQNYVAVPDASPLVSGVASSGLNSVYKTTVSSIQSDAYHYWFAFSFNNSGTTWWFLWGLGSNSPIKFQDVSRYNGFLSSAINHSIFLTGRYDSSGVPYGYQAWTTSFVVYEDVPSYSYAYCNDVPWFDYWRPGIIVGRQCFDNTILTVPWLLDYSISSEPLFYTYFTDDNPVQHVTTVTGGGGRTYEDYYSYDYDVDESGDYVPGSGNVGFDFGAGSVFENFFNKGFIADITGWIAEGHAGGTIPPITLFSFSADMQGKQLLSDGYVLDLNNDSLWSSLLRVLVPIFYFEIVIGVWNLIIAALTGIKFLGSSDSEQLTLEGW